MSLPEAGEPQFPPLLRGQDSGREPPWAVAKAQALDGADPGLLCYRLTPERLQASLLLAPEMRLEAALGTQCVAAIGFADALGALGPPEVGVYFQWPGTILINGARAGNVRTHAPIIDPDLEPDWLLVSLDLRIYPTQSPLEPGDTPNETSLIEEGCGEVAPTQLLESWSRHTLVWLHRFMEEGFKPVHADWMGRAHGVGEPYTINDQTGTFVGLDERGGLLLQTAEKTVLIPLSQCLES